jgi:hypothetical protein
MEQDVNFIKLFEAHEARDVERFADIHNTLEEIRDTLKPISEAFTSVSMLGKWGMGILVAVSVIVGISISIFSALKK